MARWLKRNHIAITAGIAVLAGLALSWEWLAASGLLLVVLAGLGCVAMCGLGLACGHRKDGDRD